MKLKVKYTAVFETVIDVDDGGLAEGEDVSVYSERSWWGGLDEICDIEPGSGEYKSDSFEVLDVAYVPVVGFDTILKADVTIENHGTLFLFHLHTNEVKEWIKENVSIEGYMWRTDVTFACEHSVYEELINGMEAEGFVLRPAGYSPMS